MKFELPAREKIQMMRKRRGYNQEVGDKTLGLYQNLYSKRERGTLKFTCEEMLTLCREWHYDPRFLTEEISIVQADRLECPARIELERFILTLPDEAVESFASMLQGYAKTWIKQHGKHLDSK
jgi:DNA-binding XRE family transcriptional regulator